MVVSAVGARLRIADGGEHALLEHRRHRVLEALGLLVDLVPRDLQHVGEEALDEPVAAHDPLGVIESALLTVATYAAAVDLRGDHPDTYVVQRGDTLWDIAGRFLKRPWLWPEIWQANPQVQNPHLIYPGDVLSLA